jgi:starch phosphorylase
MTIHDRFGTHRELPAGLAPLQELSRNLWWSWDNEALELLQELDPTLWKAVRHNPVAVLADISADRLAELAADAGFTGRLQGIVERFRAHMGGEGPHIDLDFGGRLIGYFSAEYGLHESLSIYSGGLGILSGDHLKAASDLGLPLVAVGMAYRYGYFHQQIDLEGRQHEAYTRNDFERMPMSLQVDDEDRPLIVTLPYPGREVCFRMWKVAVGRIPLYLLDTDVESNNDEDRAISSHLYGGNNDTRVRQEFLLGVGGLRALSALGIAPAVCHMNEGHSAFLGLEQLRRQVVEGGLELLPALDTIRGGNLFTTHTPVAAGNDVFDRHHVAEYLKALSEPMGQPVEQLLALGLVDPLNPDEPFGMTPLALRCARYANGVSELHGKVARGMWQGIWKGMGVEEIPIDSVTNGVHMPTWIDPQLGGLYKEHLSEDPSTLPSEHLWQRHEELRAALVEHARSRLRRQFIRCEASAEAVAAIDNLLDPGILTIGFARRFAPYKRATLLMRDQDRLARLLNDTSRPVQILIAGKAHPRNEPGKLLMRQVWELSQRPEFKGRVLLLENYNIELGRALVRGVDVWLNTPRRPLEASGTSGMKAAANGVLNLSVLDGWWCEGYDGRNGWAFGDGDGLPEEAQDERDALELYELLENAVVPEFYDRGADGLPHAWIERMKAAVGSVLPRFSAVRMVDEYADRFYLPCAGD